MILSLESFGENIYSQDGFHYGLPCPPEIEIIKRPHIYCSPAWRQIKEFFAFLKYRHLFLIIFVKRTVDKDNETTE